MLTVIHPPIFPARQGGTLNVLHNTDPPKPGNQVTLDCEVRERVADARPPD